ncbi:MAG: biosynthetic arginine decarboxylase [Parachlamydiaceae bacterium]|nr:biosynthetic arginine decarboxylase [Parachlamydiaceae bacterium]
MSTKASYKINRWGKGYFSINSNGHVTVSPENQSNSGDLYKLTRSLVERGIEPPFLIRFNGILRDRIRCLYDAFEKAILQFNYRNSYRMTFPIKVNPQFHVVEIVQQAGQKNLIGLEVGSKPELIAVMALEHNPDSLLLCNGYKDREYISLALMTHKLGRHTIIIIEQLYELDLVLSIAKELNTEAQIGLRMKLSTSGSGRWKSSGGDLSKFGLFPNEIMATVELLNKNDKKNWLKLLHFHLGSQITSINAIKNALKEGARMYTELAKDHPSLDFFDVGGGLAIDYDGTMSATNSSMDYSLEEYARDVVSAIGEACLLADVHDPIIITESGRAVASHHSVLIVEVIDVTSNAYQLELLEQPPSEHDLITDLLQLKKNLNEENCRETFHDAMEAKERILNEFIYGHLTLKERAYAEKIYRILLCDIRKQLNMLNEVSEETTFLDKYLRDTYFCNFSVFQSLPDSWAIQQIFPVMPIHRLNELATHQAILADISCDSDGKIDTFAGAKGQESFLMLHQYTTDPYYLGIFLVGAYQEILGGLHNLFGDTNVVHVELDENGEWKILKLVEGDTIEEVLGYVQYRPDRLMERLEELIERSLKSGLLSPAESGQLKRKYKQALESYTYLVV